VPKNFPIPDLFPIQGALYFLDMIIQKNTIFSLIHWEIGL